MIGTETLVKEFHYLTEALAHVDVAKAELTKAQEYAKGCGFLDWFVFKSMHGLADGHRYVLWLEWTRVKGLLNDALKVGAK